VDCKTTKSEKVNDELTNTSRQATKIARKPTKSQELVSKFIKCHHLHYLKILLSNFVSGEDKTVSKRTINERQSMKNTGTGILIVYKKPRQVRVKKLHLKNGTAVDPKSKLNSVAHVFRRDKVLYNCVLGLTYIQKNKNLCCKLQVLESDSPNKQFIMIRGYQYGKMIRGYQYGCNFWLFSSWGRAGTAIESSKANIIATADLAVPMFEKLYEEQTGN
jgi:hypothetical protein